MSSQIASIANEPIRAPAERSREGDVRARAGEPQVAGRLPPIASTPSVSVSKEAPELSAAVETVRTVVSDLQRQLQFSVDEDSGRTIITVIDRESGKIIRQIPPEELLEIAETVAGGGNINLIDGRA